MRVDQLITTSNLNLSNFSNAMSQLQMNTPICPQSIQQKRIFTSVCVAGLILLSACASVDVSPGKALQTTTSQFGIDPATVVVQRPARFGSSAPGARYAPFQLGLYMQTKTDVVLFSYSNKTKSFEKVLTLPISEIKQVAIESWGMFNHLKQLQITAGKVVLAINFNNSSDAIAASIEDTKPQFDSLVAAGVKQGQPYGRVIPEEIEGFTFPIIIR